MGTPEVGRKKQFVGIAVPAALVVGMLTAGVGRKKHPVVLALVVGMLTAGVGRFVGIVVPVALVGMLTAGAGRKKQFAGTEGTDMLAIVLLSSTPHTGGVVQDDAAEPCVNIEA